MERSLLRPFRALRPAPERAGEVAAPPYDVVSREEAYRAAKDNPLSFLHVSRAEVDLPPGACAYSGEVYAKASANLARLMEEGVLRQDPVAGYYVYRLSLSGHTQTGIAGAVAIAAYETERIRRHELTRPDKVEDRQRHIAALDAQSGPVLLIHRPLPAAKAIIGEIVASPAALDIAGSDGTRHALWPVVDAGRIEALSGAYETLTALYIADGHHRTAAALKVAQERRRGEPDPEAPHERFLAVAFPADEVRLFGYHRMVRDLGGHAPARFLEALGEAFGISPVQGPLQPESRHRFGMYLAGRWYRLELRAPPPAGGPVLDRLDVSLLSKRLLEPILGITDPRQDDRIDFVGGPAGLSQLERRVDGGQMAVGFALHPASVQELMAVADAGQVMPPKSTWFDPKLADGLMTYRLDGTRGGAA